MSHHTETVTEIKYFCGLDVSDKFTHYCILDKKGLVHQSGKCRTNRAAITRLLEGFESTRVALEVGPHSRWMNSLLLELGFEVMVANARKVRLIYGGHTKNDLLDSEKLARLCRVDPTLLHPVVHRDDELQLDLQYIKSRKALVKARAMQLNHVRGTLKATGVKVSKGKKLTFTARVRETVEPELLKIIEPLLEVIDVLSSKIAWYQKEIERLAAGKYAAETGLLRQVNGVGPITSLAYVLSIGDPHRFSKSRKVGSYLGLRPKQDNSGDGEPELRITKAGNPDLRSLLVQSAHYILGPFGKDSDLRRWGLKKAEGGKRAKKRAVIGVARKLSVLLHRLWVTGEVYNPLRSQQNGELTACQVV